MKDGHRIPYRDHSMAPTKILIRDPCPFGLAKSSTLALTDPEESESGAVSKLGDAVFKGWLQVVSFFTPDVRRDLKIIPNFCYL